MRNMTIQTVAAACGGEIIADEGLLAAIRDTEVLGVVSDNRKVEKDYVFVPFVGQNVDGHDFIPQAMEAGAVFVLSERRLDRTDIPYVLVEDSGSALKAIAAYYRRQLTIPIVGIIGSVGKTSTKEMTASVLEKRYRVCKTQGNFNNEIGLPLTLLSIRPEDEVAVVEMGISDFGEMHRLGEVAMPNIVVMTNIAPCHLEQLHDLDGVLKAKTEIFDHLAGDATVILNTDDEKLATIGEIPGARVMAFGTHGQEIGADHVTVLGVEGIEARIHAGAEEWPVAIPLPGAHNIYHALAATAVGLTLGIGMQEIVDGVEQTAGLAGRSNFIKLKDDITIIDDCYNASPISVKAALKLLSGADGCRIAVLGDMGELGEDAVDLHREVGEYLATLPIQELYTAGPLARELGQAVAESESECRVHSFDTRDAMMAALVFEIRPSSFVLVKASHFMEFSKVVDNLKANLS